MRQLAHKLIAVAFWIVLIGGWTLLARSDALGTEQVLHSVQYVAVVAGAVLAVTLWWIRHNTNIYKQKGPRRGRPENPPRTDEDRLGRPIRWQLETGAGTALHASHLIVDLDGSAKVYRAGA